MSVLSGRAKIEEKRRLAKLFTQPSGSIEKRASKEGQRSRETKVNILLTILQTYIHIYEYNTLFYSISLSRDSPTIGGILLYFIPSG